MALIVGPAEMPVYLRIADNAKHLRELGMSDETIARALRVRDKLCIERSPDCALRAHD